MKVVQGLIETCKSADRNTKVQILSSLSPLTFPVIKKMIPSVSKIKFLEARKHYKYLGPSVPRLTHKLIRKSDRATLQDCKRFIVFLLLDDNVHDT